MRGLLCSLTSRFSSYSETQIASQLPEFVWHSYNVQYNLMVLNWMVSSHDVTKYQTSVIRLDKRKADAKVCPLIID